MTEIDEHEEHEEHENTENKPSSKKRVRRGQSVTYQKSKVNKKRKEIAEDVKKNPMTLASLLKLMLESGMTPYELSKLTGLSPDAFIDVDEIDVEELESEADKERRQRLKNKLNKVSRINGLGEEI